MVCAVTLGRVFQDFLPPAGAGGETDHNNPRRSFAKRLGRPSGGFLELEIVTGKISPQIDFSQIPVRRIMRIPLADISYRT
jgi:hypothetical protein